ncbi:tripartite tricarboxylate transporter substrate binding protein [Allopusillimonas soli]|uniref:Tripartite tricarboxylate transporter substrate binding protein n=1 Tax=Allopusillimonas soli TaxID=659016 RepID=A0A853F778_9BURK|nr:tripartite tricarboxylate transporter substrate binding protein [Allopusillimonas soli]NYT35953.1 tripartite tricarboxylate transporter substrate binding protein [Allopusillimonas soli]TEA76302.1 tripartite tricarboxylate transporter substrate binding protein [Allopusillimonas soli]
MSYKTLAATAALALGVLSAAPAIAAFPDHAIEIVVPFSPGGGTDQISRTIADGMAKSLGQPVVVMNKPGAGTIIGTGYVAKAKPDGYTLVMATFAHVVNPSLHKDLPFDIDKDFKPVALVGTSPNVLVVNSKSPYKSVKDIIDYAKAHPSKLTFGSYGTGTSAHLAAALFENLANVKMTHVPYKGSSPAITDLLGGQIDMVFSTAASVSQYVKAGRLRAIAVTAKERSTAFPDTPTIAESGLPDYAAESWYGLLAPAGTPDEAIQVLNQAAGKAIQSDEFQRQIKTEGLNPHVGPPKDLQDYISAEEQRWRKVVHDAHISLQ